MPATTRRMRFCGMRSATTPASSAGRMTPSAAAVATTLSWEAPPPSRTTSQTWATTQMPPANVEKTRAMARRR